MKAGNQHIPAVRTRQFATKVEMKSGQTFVLSGLTKQTGKPGDESRETLETLILITSEIVDAPLTAQTRASAQMK